VGADQIARGLYIGGVLQTCGPFDVVVLAAREFQDLSLPCKVIHAPLDDSVPTKSDIALALSAARQVQALRRRGAKVLVTCAQGRNRSALIVALVLMMEGMSADQAIQRVVERRKSAPFGLKALTNRDFIKVLREYERCTLRRCS
jgi:protein-tyrosine phosphatase